MGGGRQQSRSQTRNLLANVSADDISYDMWELLWCMNKQATSSEWFMVQGIRCSLRSQAQGS